MRIRIETDDEQTPKAAAVWIDTAGAVSSAKAHDGGAAPDDYSGILLAGDLAVTDLAVTDVAGTDAGPASYGGEVAVISLAGLDATAGNDGGAAPA